MSMLFCMNHFNVFFHLSSFKRLLLLASAFQTTNKICSRVHPPTLQPSPWAFSTRLILASVVQDVDSAIHRINHYPEDKY